VHYLSFWCETWKQTKQEWTRHSTKSVGHGFLVGFTRISWKLLFNRKTGKSRILGFGFQDSANYCAAVVLQLLDFNIWIQKMWKNEMYMVAVFLTKALSSSHLQIHCKPIFCVRLTLFV